MLERKLAALAAHQSQIGPVRDALGPEGLRRLAAAEAYRPGNFAALRMMSDPEPIAA
ncbi:MAG: hypothetical protein GY724_20930 [Actinomycetia bacterium]|nr:hypothetical protein [Actinomycetes bacterium]MCP4225624.1 hypothetical protein [Actinomycetes bacterium]MCP5034761.1 hypothetical protein [Actinomycetes bacterium]